MFAKAKAWPARHRRMAGLLRILFLVVLCAALTLPFAPFLPGSIGYVVLTPALIAPLYWRDRHPRTVFAVISALCLVQWLSEIAIAPADFAVLAALWSVASRCSWRWAVAALLVTELGVFMALSQWRMATTGMFTTGSILVVTVWVTALYARTRRRYLESLVERAERAERERDQRARLAAAEERARIARELHDVVAHGVSVIVVQADGARYTLDEDPETARDAMATISKTGREALAEMRRMVGVLRTDNGPAADGTASADGAGSAGGDGPAGGEPGYLPQPGLAQLAELVRGSGVPAGLHVTGDPGDLPEGRQLAIYRIVQEALTNVLKHGGPEAHATVEVDLTGPEILIRITDDGRGAAAAISSGGHSAAAAISSGGHSAAAAIGSGGHGLTGMRERTGMYGGALTAGPRTGGGFEVLATLPAEAT